MSLKSGFYNAVEIESGVFDRSYSADEYTDFYSAFLKDGVRRSGLNDLVCSAAGLVVTVGEGYAIAGSKWIHNDTAATLPTITPPTGQYSRIDGVFLHVDTNEETRAASFVYRTGTPAATPTPPSKSTASGIFELCLCYVAVAPNATTVQITDKRGDASVCGWVTSPVGYDDYFDQFETEFAAFIANETNAFETWFSNLRETVATTTLFKQYTQYIKTTAASTTTATIEITQYDPTGVDILQVYCNGMLLIYGVDYSVSGTTITFNVAKVKDTEILIVVYKSIDGAGLGSVSDEVTQLQTDVAGLQTDVQNLQGLITTQTFSIESTFGIAGHAQADKIFVIEKTGYTPVAIGSIRVATDSSLIGIAQFAIRRIDNQYKAYIGLINTGSSTQYVGELYVNVVYVKNIS